MELGFRLNAEDIEETYKKFIELADKKKAIYDDDLVAIVRDQISEVPLVYTLEYLHVSTGTDTVPTATVKLRKSNKILQDAACGDGPVDAALKTIERISKTKGRVLDFFTSIHYTR